MLGAVWTQQVSGLVVHSDGEGQQKKPNLESQLHCYRLLLFSQGSGPKVGRAVHSPKSPGTIQGSYLISCMLSRTP